jgi:hypothetical protein
VDALVESRDGVTPGIYEVDGGHVEEVVLPLHGRRFWHLSGALRVLVLNLMGIWRMMRRKYDVVVCSDSIYALPGMVARLFLRKGFVYNSHEIMWALGNPSLISAILGWLEWLSLITCNFWMVPSEARAQIILKKHRLEKAYVVVENLPTKTTGYEDRSLYQEQLYQKGVHRGIPVLMFQGSLTEKRGLEQLVEVSRSSGAFHFVVQGSGPLLPYLEKNQHIHMTLLDPCPNDEAVSWLSAADLSFVYYENDCLNSAYACSSKFYVSVFAGVPLLCNRLPAFELFAAEHGGVAFIDGLDRESIEQCVADVLSGTGKLSSLKQDILIVRQKLSLHSPEEAILSAFFSYGI